MISFLTNKDNSVKDFRPLTDVKQFMSDAYSEEDFEGCGHMLILQNDSLRIWILSTKKNIYFVMDNKRSFQVLYSSDKRNFDYDILKKDRPVYGEILFYNAKKPLPFDKGLTGDTSTFEKKLNGFLVTE